jgi:hypothetical protein
VGALNNKSPTQRNAMQTPCLLLVVEGWMFYFLPDFLMPFCWCVSGAVYTMHGERYGGHTWVPVFCEDKS